VVTLGNKGYMLCELARLGLSVPQGLVLTTGLFPARHELRRGGRLRERLEQAVGAEIARLEEVTGTHLGDPAAPLLLSVRGGAPVSMPGMLTTFLNVGMTVEIAEGLAARIGGWAAWDAYRRFVQFWGMAHGLARDPFDAAMRGAKRRSAVPRKALLLPSEMRTLALEYEALVRESGVPIEGDPFEQVMRCIELVHDSWDAEAARVYRDEVGIAEEWGTAVILQVMVFGNLGPRSGAGVVQTGDAPRTREGVLLTGDFTVQGQGDDVVGGVVETHPVSERERQTEGRGGPLSLERDFPAIHQALCQVGQTLVSGEGMNHQEIEFTFESDRPEGLYLLQTRDSVVARGGEVEAFIPSPSLAGSRVAVGIGVSGGALSGRVAHSAAEIDEVARLYPGTPVILLRPDTVPDDVALVVRSDGVLTALGGATSHAAVVAKRLGKSCVVGCRALDVDEHLGRSSIGGHELRCGDPVSISGLDGAVYIGSHAAETVRVAGRAQQ
jgi:pyruvate,orthophosphate dikinase